MSGATVCCHKEFRQQLVCVDERRRRSSVEAATPGRPRHRGSWHAIGCKRVPVTNHWSCICCARNPLNIGKTLPPHIKVFLLLLTVRIHVRIHPSPRPFAKRIYHSPRPTNVTNTGIRDGQVPDRNVWSGKAWRTALGQTLRRRLVEQVR